jgi:hypothetical protein
MRYPESSPASGQEIALPVATPSLMDLTTQPDVYTRSSRRWVRNLRGPETGISSYGV